MSRLRMVMNVGDASRLRRVRGRGDPGFFTSVAKLGAGLGKLIPGLGTAISVGEGIGALGPTIFGKPKASSPVKIPTSLPPGVPASSPLGQVILGNQRPSLPMSTSTAIVPFKPPTTRSSSALTGGMPGVVSGGSSTAPFTISSSGVVRRRYRRMNPTNFRALTRGIRRIKAFAKLAKQVLRAEQRIKAPRKGRFRRKKR